MKDPTFQVFSLITNLLRFQPTQGDQLTPTREPHPYIHIQFIGVVIFSTLAQPIHLLFLNLHDEHTSTFSLPCANYLLW